MILCMYHSRIMEAHVHCILHTCTWTHMYRERSLLGTCMVRPTAKACSNKHKHKHKQTHRHTDTHTSTHTHTHTQAHTHCRRASEGVQLPLGVGEETRVPSRKPKYSWIWSRLESLNPAETLASWSWSARSQTKQQSGELEGGRRRREGGRRTLSISLVNLSS